GVAMLLYLRQKKMASIMASATPSEWPHGADAVIAAAEGSGCDVPRRAATWPPVSGPSEAIDSQQGAIYPAVSTRAAARHLTNTEKEHGMVRRSCVWTLIISMLVLGSVRAGQAEVRRLYYLTTTPVDGSQATQACLPTFHMASLWEIFNMTTL